MAQRDYYEILGVSRAASQEEIKRAYRKMAMQYHPDHNPDDPEAEQRFKDAAQAYEVLRDPERRARYDQFGEAGVNGGSGFASAEDIFAHFGDIFGDIFGFAMGGRRAGGGPGPEAGADLRYDLTISFDQAAHGAEIPLSIPRRVACGECEGSGVGPGGRREPCSRCGGSGRVSGSNGFFRVAVPCPNCKGEGMTITKPCPRCKGSGVVQETQELSVRIPAGVDSGTRLRLRGEGEAGRNGGPTGDLYVFLAVEEDKRFRRHGQDLLTSVEVSFPQAALGHKLTVEGLDGPVQVQVPKGTQSGEIFRIQGQGLPYLDRSRTGDLLVEVRVATPVRLNARQEELLREFERAGEERPMEKVKKVARKIGKAMGMD